MLSSSLHAPCRSLHAGPLTVCLRSNPPSSSLSPFLVDLSCSTSPPAARSPSAEPLTLPPTLPPTLPLLSLATNSRASPLQMVGPILELSSGTGDDGSLRARGTSSSWASRVGPAGWSGRHGNGGPSCGLPPRGRRGQGRRGAWRKVWQTLACYSCARISPSRAASASCGACTLALPAPFCVPDVSCPGGGSSPGVGSESCCSRARVLARRGGTPPIPPPSTRAAQLACPPSTDQPY